MNNLSSVLSLFRLKMFEDIRKVFIHMGQGVLKTIMALNRFKRCLFLGVLFILSHPIYRISYSDTFVKSFLELF